jgi:hypothetical protein
MKLVAEQSEVLKEAAVEAIGALEDRRWWPKKTDLVLRWVPEGNGSAPQRLTRRAIPTLRKERIRTGIGKTAGNGIREWRRRQKLRLGS